VATPDILADSQEKSLRELRQRRKRHVTLLVSAFFLSLIVFSIFKESNFNSKLFDEVVSHLSEYTAITDIVNYHNWLIKNSSHYEVKFFEATSSRLLMLSIRTLDIVSDPSATNINQITLPITHALIRVTFVLSVSMRYWLLGIFIGILYQIFKLRPYKGLDFMGQTGNGRFYFSGIRLGLEHVRESTSLLARGLACPLKASSSEAYNSRMYKILKNYKAESETNLELISIILAYANWPNSLPNAQLSEDATLTTLDQVSVDLLETIFNFLNNTSITNKDSSIEDAITNILSKSLLNELLKIDKKEIATVILAMQAGKVLLYAKQNGTWIEKSRYPQLSARAVLHSTINFSREYNALQRTRIRQALIYAQRTSYFGPIALPDNMSYSTQALRCLAELLLTDPAKISVKAPQIELFARCWEIEQALKNNFLSNADRLKVLEGCYYSTQGLILVPVQKFIKVLKEISGDIDLKRIEKLQNELVNLEENKKFDFSHKENSSNTFGRLLAKPIYNNEYEQITEMHSIDKETIKLWSALRVPLQAYGWLAQKIGHHSMPENGLILGIAKEQIYKYDVPSTKLVELKALVPLRISKINSLKDIISHFSLRIIAEISLADNEAEQKNLLSGKTNKKDLIDSNLDLVG
jgi:hypothetical protein